MNDSDKKSASGQPRSKKNKIIAILVIAAAVGGAAYFLQKADNKVDSTFPSVDGIPCETEEYSTYHIHVHLDVFVNGQHATVPQYIGIKDNTCLYWLHTHDTSGIMHIESPQQRNFTLGQFVDMWKATSSGVPSGDPIIFVNGQEVSTDFNTTILNAHDEISLVYGQSPPNIPSFYQFPEGL